MSEQLNKDKAGNADKDKDAEKKRKSLEKGLDKDKEAKKPRLSSQGQGSSVVKEMTSTGGKRVSLSSKVVEVTEEKRASVGSDVRKQSEQKRISVGSMKGILVVAGVKRLSEIAKSAEESGTKASEAQESPKNVPKRKGSTSSKTSTGSKRMSLSKVTGDISCHNFTIELTKSSSFSLKKSLQNESADCAGPSNQDDDKDGDKDAKKKKNRCVTCKKKVGLTGKIFEKILLLEVVQE